MFKMNQEEQNFEQQIQAWKRTLARKFATNLNVEFVNDFKNMSFTKPKRLGNNLTVRSVGSTSCSADFEREEEGKHQTIDTSAYDGSKRVNKITEFLLAFEEKCLIDGLMGESHLRAFRSLNRGVLGKVLENLPCLSINTHCLSQSIS